MKKIIAFSLWGNNPKYTIGALKNAELAKTIYPDWICRFYLAQNVPKKIVNQLKKYQKVEVIRKTFQQEWEASLWRFLPASENDVSIMISRNTDSRLNWREKVAVDEWLNSDKICHIMRDHPQHRWAIMGGMWGIKQNYLPNISSLIEDYLQTVEKDKITYGIDQLFLRDVIYPLVKDVSLVHDEFVENYPFPTPRENYFFVGQSFLENDSTPVDNMEELKNFLLNKQAIIQQELQKGINYLQSGNLTEAEKILQEILKVQINHSDSWHLLGIISAQKQDFNQAIEQISQAIKLHPNQTIFYDNLANVYQNQGDIEKAITSFLKVIELKPQSWDTYYKLGILYGQNKDFISTIKYLEKFVQAQPNNIDGYANLGVAYAKQEQLEKAIASFNQALALNPNHITTLNNLANAYIENEELDKAVVTCQKAIELKSNYPETYYHLALALQKQDKLSEAVKYYEEAVKIKPNYPEAYNNLGNIVSKQGKFTEAIKYYQKALEIEPELKNTLYTLGNVLLSQGRTNEVIESYQKASNLDPEFLVARTNYLFSLNYSTDYSPEKVYQEHQKWSELYEKPLKELIPHHKNNPNPDKKIRVGYVSGDFKKHSVSFFLEAILNNYNRQNLEVICYYNGKQIDETTSRLKTLVDGWRQIESQEDEEVSQLIQQDEIDILVDLSGHTSGNRLLLFARKPAPIQVSYVGYPNTTGLKNIDYHIVDNYTDPVGETEKLYSERLIRLPNCFLCYTPPINTPEVSLSPYLKNKYITFGSFNNFAKITPTIINYWSQILNTIPNSKLILKTNYVIDEESQNYWYELLQNGRIERERVQLVSKIADINQHLAFYENIDIALDTFPYHGTTTTCEALLMGVPVFTLAGKTHVARVGISILSAVGLGELIAESGDDYIQKAVNLAQNLEKLADLRQNLRQKMQVSPLTNGKLFTESLENAYRQMWQTWCEKSANNSNLSQDNNLKNDSLNNNKLANISQSKPSIIIIDGVFFQMYKTGIARVWRSLLTEWANTDFADHILVLDRVNTAPKINGIRYRTIQAYDYENTEKDYILLQKICDEEKAELFISSYYTIPITTPSVFMAYDMIPEVLGGDLNQPMWKEKHKAIKHASAFISISENTARDLHKFFPKIPLESITVAHCGVDSRFCPSNITEINNFKYKYGIKQSYFLLGNLTNYKNLILFFKAFSQLTNKTNFDIVATGTGSQLPSQWRQYTSGCTFHQLYLPDEELRLAYGGALALVYPSQYEGFGMPVVEAMACGCPVITTPNSSLPEVAGKAAIYVKDIDIEAMANALCDVQKPSLRHHLIQAGLQQAQKFSWKKMAEIVKNTLLTVKNY